MYLNSNRKNQSWSHSPEGLSLIQASVNFLRVNVAFKNTPCNKTENKQYENLKLLPHRMTTDKSEDQLQPETYQVTATSTHTLKRFFPS